MSHDLDKDVLTDEQAIDAALQELRDDLTPPQPSTSESELFSQAPHQMDELASREYGPMYRGCAIVGALVLIVTLIVVYQLGFAKIAVPNIVGQTVAEATAQIQDAGLVVGSFSEKEVSGAAEGTVVDQTPRADTKVSKGDKVDIVLAIAGDETRVPNLVNKSLQEAESLLVNERLRFETITTFSDTIAEGTIIGQLPAAGTSVPSASTVAVLVSGGSYSRSFVNPKVTGLGKDEAVKLIQDKGLTPVLAYAATTFGTIDEVVAQTPSSKTFVAPKSVIFLLIGRTPSAGDISIPEVVGKTRDEAQASLVSAGFRVETYFTVDQSIPQGNVVAQNPLSKDVLAKKGDTIYLLVSSGPDPRATVTDVLGKTLSQAKNELSELGFSVHVVQNAAALNENSAVTQQFPQGGEEYNRGLDVVIFASGE